MTDIHVDQETRRAVDALVHRLKNRGDEDHEVFALEFITALRGQGWRPTPAGPSLDWRSVEPGGGLPDPESPTGADYYQRRAEIFRKARETAPGQQPEQAGGAA